MLKHRSEIQEQITVYFQRKKKKKVQRAHKRLQSEVSKTERTYLS